MQKSFILFGGLNLVSVDASLVGQFEKIYIASSLNEKTRFKGASGGVVTELLISALKEDIVEQVIVVDMDNDHPWHYRVFITNKEDEIKSAAGSKYVFIGINEFLPLIKNTGKKTAIVGVPCNVAILRNIQKNNPHIKLIIGLFCGYNMPLEATEFLLKKLKIKKQDIVSLEYRGGKYPGGFLIRLKNGRRKFLPKYYYDFLNLMFVPNGCLKCRDYMSEKADISVGDSWGYSESSLVIVRTRLGQSLFERAPLKNKEIGVQEVFRMHGHNLQHKKFGDSNIRLIIIKFLKVFGKYFPLRWLGATAKLRRMIIK